MKNLNKQLIIYFSFLFLFIFTASTGAAIPEYGLKVEPTTTIGGGNSFYRIGLSGTNDRGFSLQYPDAQLADIAASLRWGLTDFIDIGAELPAYLDKIKNKTETGPGDIKLSTKFIYPPYPHISVFDLAFWGAFSLPTGSRNTGYFSRKFTNNKYPYTSGDIDFTVLVLGSLDFRKMKSIPAPLTIRFNLGEEFTGQASQEDFYKAGVGATFFISQYVEWLIEFSGNTKAISGISPAHDILLFSSGFKFNIASFQAFLGGDFSLSDPSIMLIQPKAGVKETQIQPKYSISFIFSYLFESKEKSDTDHDGIYGRKDKCPNQPEDMDGYKDDDGCPDLDNDKDSIPDVSDKCPNQAEDIDGFEDADGCPDFDNDKDGVPDSLDKCLNKLEDMDGYKDDDGCPDYDNDNDSIPDISDKCPNQSEDIDGFEDIDGCPDYDNDNDGVADSVDKCPDQKETFNGFSDKDGCPDEKPKEIKVGRTVLGNVKFVQGSNLLKAESYKELDILANSLKAFPNVSIEIHGHTDNFGSRKSTQELSEKMAKAVMDYLIKKGVAPEKLIPKGFGKEQPLVPNTSPEARETNIRIEIVRPE